MNDALHVVVGAGPVGSAVAIKLADAGERVRLISRSGGGPEHPLIGLRAADATDRLALREATSGATVLYNCANPRSYTQWRKVWPPLAEAVLAAATAHGAVLVTFGNLYGHGPVDGDITADTPLAATHHLGRLRADVWRQALAAHEAGRVRASEVRASDYIGPDMPFGNGMLGIYAQRTLRDKPAMTFSDADQPHSWTVLPDIVEVLVAAARDEGAWGRPWVVPNNPPRTIRQVLTELAHAADAGEPRLRRIPPLLLRAMGTAVPLVREVRGVLYQFDAPFVADGAETTESLGVAASPWEPLITQTAKAWRARLAR